MPVMQLPNSTAMNGRAACSKFARTASPGPPRVVLQVVVAALEVALEPVGVSADAVDSRDAVDLVVG